MKTIFLSLIVICVIFSFSCQKPDVKNAENKIAEIKNANTAPHEHDSSPQAASTQPKDGNYPGHGKITKINMQLGSVELDHEEIVGVMPPMIMEFYVKDKAILNDVKVGDMVDFTLEYKHPTETIVEIKKSK